MTVDIVKMLVFPALMVWLLLESWLIQTVTYIHHKILKASKLSSSWIVRFYIGTCRLIVRLTSMCIYQ